MQVTYKIKHLDYSLLWACSFLQFFLVGPGNLDNESPCDFSFLISYDFLVPRVQKKNTAAIRTEIFY